MSLKSVIAGAVSQAITSPLLRSARREAYRWRRGMRRMPATVLYFHQHDDPYSQLLAERLPLLLQRYSIQLECYAVPEPPESAAPDRIRLKSWSVRDAQRLAQRLAASPMQTSQIVTIPPASPENLALGAAMRAKLGHYLGAMLYFEGEWYWGVDRLHHLESRLRAAGLAQEPSERPFIFSPPALRFEAQSRVPTAKPEIHFFCSLRSPYTYLAAPQIRKLAEHYGVTLQLRFVLPMVMRGLPVPWIKRLYILRDTKREAERLGVPFGKIVDPVGKPVEHGLAVLHHAMAQGLGSQWLECFLSSVFAQGVDASVRANLLSMATQVGMTEPELKSALADEAWRSVAERNREEMLGGGIWGVPAFRVGDGPIYWGQDRLWMLEEDLLAALKQAQSTEPQHGGSV
jgi:2-hydroxychromene-2-carboxylate isomerase